MAGPVGELPASVLAALKVTARPVPVQGVLPFADDVGKLWGAADEADALAAAAESARGATRFSSSTDEMLQMALDLPKAVRPKVVIVGIGRTPPKTTQSLVQEAVARGMVPGEDIIVTRYADLRVGVRRGFVRVAGQPENLAGKGVEALFLFRGGGNLKPRHLEKIAKIQSVEGATAITDLGFIERAGSKALTHGILEAAGLPLAVTRPVKTADEAIAAMREITGGEGTVVLKKVNSLGGKDVHFVSSPDEIRSVMTNPDEEFVVQEVIKAAKDQDVRVHLVWNDALGRHTVQNSYVRNRNAFHPTPNLANGGYPTFYELSPWEQDVAERAAAALSKGSERPPLHIGLDFFPRETITASTVERNSALQQSVAAGVLTRERAITQSAGSAVIGEAASSAGTKGTEMVLGEGVNPVALAMMRELDRARGVLPTTARTIDDAYWAGLVSGTDQTYHGQLTRSDLTDAARIAVSDDRSRRATARAAAEAVDE